jgi:hypothetical protein
VGGADGGADGAGVGFGDGGLVGGADGAGVGDVEGTHSLSQYSSQTSVPGFGGAVG